MGSNPIRIMWDFSALTSSCVEQGMLWIQWTAELHPFHGYISEDVGQVVVFVANTLGVAVSRPG